MQPPAGAERRTFYANVRVELRDATEEEAREFWLALELAEHEIEVGGRTASIVWVTPPPRPTIFPPDSEEESRRYHGD
jgi:hypothetical protein